MTNSNLQCWETLLEIKMKHIHYIFAIIGRQCALNTLGILTFHHLQTSYHILHPEHLVNQCGTKTGKHPYSRGPSLRLLLFCSSFRKESLTNSLVRRADKETLMKKALHTPCVAWQVRSLTSTSVFSKYTISV